MPWSPWITPAPEPVNAIYVRGLSGKLFELPAPEASLEDAVVELRGVMAGGVPVDSETLLTFTQSFTESAETYEEAGEVLGSPGDFQASGNLTQRDWWISTIKRFESIGGLGNLRNWFPDEMNDLEYGVDYGPRPDRDEMEDDDAYIEYEPGFDSTRVGWQGIAQLDYSASTPFDGSATGELRLESAWTPPDLPVPMPGEAGETWWSDAGTFLGGYTGDDASGPGSPIIFGDDLPDADEFAIVLSTPVFSGGLPAFGPGDVWVQQQAVKANVQVDVMVQYPRFRYWIPGILPLRQYPRNDGLRGGAPNARATSRQATTARRTYL